MYSSPKKLYIPPGKNCMWTRDQSFLTAPCDSLSARVKNHCRQNSHCSKMLIVSQRYLWGQVGRVGKEGWWFGCSRTGSNSQRPQRVGRSYKCVKRTMCETIRNEWTVASWRRHAQLLKPHPAKQNVSAKRIQPERLILVVTSRFT